MKKLLALLLFAAIASAHATPKCIHYTQQEMDAMTVNELKTAIAENKEKIDEFSTMFASQRAERHNCLVQNQRLSTVLGAKTGGGKTLKVLK